MIKVQTHPICCDCEDCRALFPADRFDVTWSQPPPEADDVERVTAQVPIGDGPAAMRFHVWVDGGGRLVRDFPGFPGTMGAEVQLRRGGGQVAPHITGTRDPMLRALSQAWPLRRRLVERLNARCMVEFGLAELGTADHIPCDIHGHGAPANTCAHLQEGPPGQEAVMLYGLDGDLPDCLCPDCVDALAAGQIEVCVPICSHCQQALVYRCQLVASTSYGSSE